MPRTVLCLLALSMTAVPADAADKPIKALLVTGGCCHDYARQKLIITKGVAARANVEWTIVHQGGSSTDSKIPLYEDENWADGFDVVVHNECFANVKDPRWLRTILEPHRNGTPAVLIHCAMHCYRVPGTDDWFEFVGIQSPGHGPHYSFEVENVAAEHPIMKGFGDSWTAPKGELYHSPKIFPTATPLATAKRQSDGTPQTCIWTNQYGKTRVFATTVGHYNETMADPKYLDMLTRGILWAAGRLEGAELKETDEKTNDAIKALATARVDTNGGETLPTAGCCMMDNLAFDKPTKSSSEESGKNNFAKNAVDGRLGTRWCANGGRSGEWWQVDLGKPSTVRNVRIHWERKQNAAYRYTVEGSTDGDTWTTLVDASKNDKASGVTADAVKGDAVRYLRVNFLGCSTGGWGSFWEFEAYGGELPELPEAADNSGGPAATIADVTAPAGFEVKLFAQPPLVNYPACLTAAANGDIYVGIDEQGSLGKQPGRGRVVRCRDIDGDGVADEVKTFAEMDHPRGLIHDDTKLWVLHPPFLTLYHDDDRDGVADRSEVLLENVSTDQVDKRGADHTTNGIRMGIDGWIYIAVGDFGFVNCKGTDGRTLTMRGGGVLRVRPDGTDMEPYAWGLRNICDVAIDPYMNCYTRDNTNDGGGWDIRLSHIVQSGEYGYPSLYKNFSDEIFPPLADYGGGSGCGAMYLQDLRWPEGYGDTLYTCDWGRSEVFRHVLPEVAPTFEAHQETFLKIPRPTDIDVDGRGLMYVSSWKGGKFSYDGPNVGFVAQIRPEGFLPKPIPDVATLTDGQLVAEFSSPSAARRLHAQRELLRRGPDGERTNLILGVARHEQASKTARIAAIFTLKQLDGIDSHEALLELAKDDVVREWALKATTDRRGKLQDVPTEPFVAALADSNPWNRAQALISLGRLGAKDAGEAILPLTERTSGELPGGEKPWAQPDTGRVLPHLAVRALVDMNAVEACVKGLDGPHFDGAVRALRRMHDPAAVEGLIARLGKETDPNRRRDLFTALVRLHHREGDYTGDWWGTRPDTTGPYYDRTPWAKSDRIAAVLKTAVADADAKTVEHIRTQLARHVVKIDGIEVLASTDPMEEAKPVVVPKFDPNDPRQIGNLDKAELVRSLLAMTGDVDKGRELFTRQSCIACHTFKDGQSPKGPHLVDIGKRSKPPELVESVLFPEKKIAQGFDTWTFLTQDGKQVVGFVTRETADTIHVRQSNGLPAEIPKAYIEARVKQETSMMPKGLVDNLTPEEFANLLAYLQSLRSGG